ncbi:glycoside hydrolase family 43 protein [Pontibacter sp. SGAir0037]|uniref:glycoside hydrolase family 43 protein n=1 Tax=Pontibacter sp. SGAir0037 TaxID=2571030 RepID=UPI0010CD1AD7|nr:glycoside hydrolase family 43 protein [Pontibacter sp. SGAir0037]QCR22377.1 glycoside hydrolase 43 family protein [Pontibacter sp. SGAir0037]
MHKRKKWSALPFLLLLAAGLGSGCADSSKAVVDRAETNQAAQTAGKAGAHFDYFSYKGQDDYYNENTLPGKDYFYNPILPGWYSDPSICKNGDDYFMVTSTFSYFPGVPIFHSKDLVNWKQIGHVLDRPSQLKLDGQKVSQGIFAPAISYNPHNQTYYMVTTNVGGGNFFVKTKDPFGPWSDPIWIREVPGIDPSFFFDDDGKAYILNNDAPDGPALYDGHRAIKIQEFDPATDKVIGPRKMLVNGGVRPEEKPIWIEGPHMYKINGQYLLMSAEGGTGPDHSEVILRGNAPMGDFKPWQENPILTQRHLDPKRANPITCAGHADLVEAKEGEWWAVFLACRPIEGKFENLGRETFLMPVRWSKDGYPYMTQGNELIPMMLQKKGVQPAQEVTYGNFEKHDDFDAAVLGKEWMTLRGDANSVYALNKVPGFLSLECAEANASELKTPAFVSRRMQHHKFEGETKLHFEPTDDKEAAGLLLFKDETHQYFLSVSKEGNHRKVCVEKISDAEARVLASKTIAQGNDPIGLKVVSEGTHYNFYYAVGKQEWTELARQVNAHYLSTANSFGFTGTNIGLYATKNPFRKREVQ